MPIGSDDTFMSREGFPEVPDWSWKVDRFGMFRFKEHITAKEARAAVNDLEYSLRDPNKHHKRLLRLVDNFGVSLAFTKMRASFLGLLTLIRRLGALRLATV